MDEAAEDDAVADAAALVDRDQLADNVAVPVAEKNACGDDVVLALAPGESEAVCELLAVPDVDAPVVRLGEIAADVDALAVTEDVSVAFGVVDGVADDDCDVCPQHVTTEPADRTHDQESPALTAISPAPSVATAVGTGDTCWFVLRPQQVTLLLAADDTTHVWKYPATTARAPPEPNFATGPLLWP